MLAPSHTHTTEAEAPQSTSPPNKRSALPPTKGQCTTRTRAPFSSLCLSTSYPAPTTINKQLIHPSWRARAKKHKVIKQTWCVLGGSHYTAAAAAAEGFGTGGRQATAATNTCCRILLCRLPPLPQQTLRRRHSPLASRLVVHRQQQQQHRQWCRRSLTRPAHRSFPRSSQIEDQSSFLRWKKRFR